MVDRGQLKLWKVKSWIRGDYYSVMLTFLNEEKQKTIFVNKSIDSKFGQRTTLSNKNTISINNFILGIKSSEFYEISVVEYNKTRLSIKIQEIAKLPRYLTESEKEKSGVKNGDL